MAERSDIEALIKMRLDFTLEHNANLINTEPIFEEYHQEMKQFLESVIDSKQWYRSHPKVMDDYYRLKKRLESLYKTDRAAYTEEKAPFIHDILAKLRSEKQT